MDFPSAIDIWVRFVPGVVGTVFALAVMLLARRRHTLLAIGLALVGMVVVGTLTRSVYTTSYRVTPDSLQIRSGSLFDEDIPRSSIHDIRPSSSWASAPAASLDRLEIRYGDGQSILVSPQDKAGFIEALR